MINGFSDNKDFYPTPKELFEQLVDYRRYFGGRILEPSAGKGDIIKYIKGRNREAKIDAIENDSQLANILMADGINVVWDDFLTYETFKEYTYIIMNPPFSNGVDHALKALELAENQSSSCEVFIILNKETLNNAYSNKRQELLRKLDAHNANIRYVSGAFSQAERKTDVEVALISVVVANKGEGKSIYDNIPFTNVTSEGAESDELETAISTFVKSNEINAKMNEIERLVLEYETACEITKTAYEANRDKASFLNYIGNVNKREGDRVSPFNYVEKAKFSVTELNSELDNIRSEYWKLILNTEDFKSILTNESIQKLNRKMESANAMEINIPNIKMLLIALGTNKEEMLIDSIISIFQRITKYHMNQYSTNIHYYDGWKTNDAYKINKKIIIPVKWEFDYWDIKDSYENITYDVRNFIDDLVKAFQLIDPTVTNEFTTIKAGEFENELLRFKMFKNGNIHVWFNDLTLLNRLNYICGSHFAWIPSEDEIKTNESARKYVVKEFGEGVLTNGLLSYTAEGASE